MKFRYYQDEAIESIWDYFRKGNTGDPLVVMPTGTGKSVVIGGFVRSIFVPYPNQRVMMITHVKELIEQNFDKLEQLWPTAPAGIYSASVGKKEHMFPITFAGIGSVVKNAHLFGHIDLILIDEAHLVSPNNNTMYRKFIEELRQINPALKVIGFTATPYRLGQGMMTEKDGLFTDICYDISGIDAFNRLIAEGFLAPLVTKRTQQQMDLSEVRIQGGEFVNKDLQLACDKDEITYGALQECLEMGHDRNKWLIFATGVEHAQHISEMLDSFGVSNVCIHGKLGKKEREKLLNGFKTDPEIRCAVNNNVLTTGFDCPSIDLIAVLRPSQSPGLWVQMLGRGTRPLYAEGFDLTTVEGRLSAMQASEKQDCLILDFAGNTRRLGPINDPVIPKKPGKGGGVAPVRECPVCYTLHHTSVKVCNTIIVGEHGQRECGHEWPASVNFAQVAGTDEVMASSNPVVEVFKVDKAFYSKHQARSKEGEAPKTPTLRVQYSCGLRTFSEVVCFEHNPKTFPAKKARDWWRNHGGDPKAIPTEIDTALMLSDRLNTPTHIRVWVNKKYPEIMAYDYTGTAFNE